MSILDKVAIATATATLAIAPVAASAAPVAFDASRAATLVDDAERGDSGTSWILILVAAAAAIGGIILAVDNNSDKPTSP